MNFNQWKFWIFSKDQLITILNNHKSISISKLIKDGYLPIEIHGLKKKVDQIKI